MSQFLKQSTACTIMFGPFVDKTDGITLKTDSTTITDIDHASTGIFLSKAGAAAAIRHATVTASVADAYGMMKVTLDTTDTGTLGRLDVLFAKAATYLPVHASYMVLPANIYDSVVAGSDLIDVSVTQILGTAVSTPATAGILDVNVKNIDNDAASASGTVTFPNATLASTTNITAGTITTVATTTDVTNNQAKYMGGAVWIDSGGGAAGTTNYTHGTVTNPNSSLANSRTIADALNLNIFEVSNGSSLTLDQGYVAYQFKGERWTLALASRAITNSHFQGAIVSGLSTGTGTEWDDCSIGTVTIANDSSFDTCGMSGTFTCQAAGQYNFIGCSSATSAGVDWILDFGALGATTIALRGWGGGVEVRNMAAGDVFGITGEGRLTIASSCTAGTVLMAGHFDFVNNGSGQTITDGSRWNEDQRLANVTLVDTITTYTGNTPQTGDGYAIVNSGTFGNSVIKTAIDDLPTNSELATALGTADDAVLAAINDLPTNTELATALGTADDAVIAAIGALNDFDPATDVVAHVTLVDTVSAVTGLTASNLDATISSRATPAQILTTALTEAYAADGVAPTLSQLLFLVQQVLTEASVASTTMTVKKLNGSTTAATFTLDDGTTPTSITRTT